MNEFLKGFIAVLFSIAACLLFRKANTWLWLRLFARSVGEAPLASYAPEIYIPEKVKAGYYPLLPALVPIGAVLVLFGLVIRNEDLSVFGLLLGLFLPFMIGFILWFGGAAYDTFANRPALDIDPKMRERTEAAIKIISSSLETAPDPSSRLNLCRRYWRAMHRQFLIQFRPPELMRYQQPIDDSLIALVEDDLEYISQQSTYPRLARQAGVEKKRLRKKLATVEKYLHDAKINERK